MVKPRENRVPIMMSDEELNLVDDWRFKNRVATRSESVRRLCHIGLTFDEHRAEFVEAFKGQYEELTKALAILADMVQGQDATEREKALGQIVLRTISKQISSLVLVRVITGIANNAKADRDIEDILKDTRELTDGLSDEFHDRQTGPDAD
ncbi:hypothetical protein [Rhizobium sp. CNPSo 4039]|uniref:hypothetical protein n=1 Tax=Rhizobium sp. CNPSo 4039 TaxID=3021409 RepID=UPI00254E1F97|nr:hypothetical protein [Rhizobium sp. CNPSo 4039]MDK4714685.1 hypothetical protein [Rhizobium sp. CNPSo 4039]